MAFPIVSNAVFHAFRGIYTICADLNSSVRSPSIFEPWNYIYPFHIRSLELIDLNGPDRAGRGGSALVDPPVEKLQGRPISIVAGLAYSTICVMGLP